jgi:tRNA (cytidine/uridine-2'-O-)-methyltransferase
MHVTLVEPEIPPNTGNVSRTCAVTGTTLHLVEPLGFSIDDRHLKRAGLDYWQHLKHVIHKDLDTFFLSIAGKRFWLLTTKGAHCYSEVRYELDDVLIFGKETAGLPRNILDRYPDQCIRIPMGREIRSLNLSNAVAVVLYEALRQLDFPGMT